MPNQKRDPCQKQACDIQHCFVGKCKNMYHCSHGSTGNEVCKSLKLLFFIIVYVPDGTLAYIYMTRESSVMR